MPLELVRSAEPSRVPGTWWGRERDRGAPSFMLARLSCPRCGAVSTLHVRRHTVFPDGAVKPRWSCPQPSCSFTTWLRLDGWVPA